MRFIIIQLLLAVIATCTGGTAPPGPWDKFNYAPSSREVGPKAIHSTHGDVQGSSSLLQTGTATLSGKESYIVLDFGQEVGKK